MILDSKTLASLGKTMNILDTLKAKGKIHSYTISTGYIIELQTSESRDNIVSEFHVARESISLSIFESSPDSHQYAKREHYWVSKMDMLYLLVLGIRHECNADKFWKK